MARTTIALIGGVILGALAAGAILNLRNEDSAATDTAVRDIVDVPKMDEAAAEQHRLDSYADIASIDQIVALPTQFARASAMHALASRLDSAELQAMIYNTDRIADDDERERLLETLFFRFAELDPRSALVLSRSGGFGETRSLERTVWHSWARKDLDDALFAANTQTSLTAKRFAAQSLYAAFGYLENDNVNRIELELGIKPDRRTRGRYLYRLADRSIDEAIAFINARDKVTERSEYTSWLAHHLALRDPADALAHADKFTVMADRDRFRAILKGYVARENPRATIENYLASGKSLRYSGELSNALIELAKTDIDAVKQYFSQVRTRDARMMIGSTIASSLAQSDPDGALEWALEQDTETSEFLMSAVLGQIAESDPERAFALALENRGNRSRSDIMQNVVHQVSRRDPVMAAGFVDRIEDDSRRALATQQLVSSWMRQDTDAAIEWVLSKDKETSGRILESTASQLVNVDVDAAIRLLPKLGDSAQANLRQQVVRQLAVVRSPQDAQAYIQQFENRDGYDQLQASLISGVAQSDLPAAKQLADQLAPGTARDSAYMQVISAQARRDPSQASGWLHNISDESVRAGAAGQLATQWYEQDAQAATQWVSSMPRGAVRDSAIMRMSYRWSSSTPEQDNLIASIENREKRGQAKVRRAYNLMRTNREEAMELLQDEDIPEAMREQAKARLSSYRFRY